MWNRGYRPSENAFGSNFMRTGFVVDFEKNNKMFKVERTTKRRELLIASKNLSDYIRYAITEKNESIWIAQRNGRTKDGNDATDKGLLKMFAMSGTKEWSLVENLKELNIVPVAVSYEWEPCDGFKTQELYVSARQKYVKSENEDLRSIISGIVTHKGRIVMKVLEPLNDTFFSSYAPNEDSDFFKDVADYIDSQIHKHYKLFANNYIAYDMLLGVERFLNNEYDVIQREKFEKYLELALSQLNGEREEVRKIFLGIYANPVINRDKESL